MADLTFDPINQALEEVVTKENKEVIQAKYGKKKAEPVGLSEPVAAPVAVPDPVPQPSPAVAPLQVATVSDERLTDQELQALQMALQASEMANVRLENTKYQIYLDHGMRRTDAIGNDGTIRRN